MNFFIFSGEQDARIGSLPIDYVIAIRIYIILYIIKTLS